MDSALFTTSRNHYIQKRKEELCCLSDLQIPEFKKLKFSCYNIDAEGKYISELVEKLTINKQSRILYYFQIDSSNTVEQIIGLVSKKKSKRRSGVKLPLVNKANLNNRVLYVGKTNSNFLTRFVTHISMKNAATYALHLEHWAKDISLELTLHYAEIDLNSESIHYLELLESMHESLKPILGRSGH